MIQRIQTIYLFLAATFVSLLFIIPYCTANSATASYYANVGGYYARDRPAVPVYPTTYFLILTGLIVITIFASIFAFSNRKTQIRLSIVSIVMIGLLVSFLINFPAKVGKVLPEMANRIEFSIGILLPILSVLFLTLAIRSIRKDEKLVKSADRLR